VIINISIIIHYQTNATNVRRCQHLACNVLHRFSFNSVTPSPPIQFCMFQSFNVDSCNFSPPPPVYSCNCDISLQRKRKNHEQNLSIRKKTINTNFCTILYALCTVKMYRRHGSGAGQPAHPVSYIDIVGTDSLFVTLLVYWRNFENPGGRFYITRWWCDLNFVTNNYIFDYYVGSVAQWLLCRSLAGWLSLSMRPICG